jgi:hypothetical protein
LIFFTPGWWNSRHKGLEIHWWKTGGLPNLPFFYENFNQSTKPLLFSLLKFVLVVHVFADEMQAQRGCAAG